MVRVDGNLGSKKSNFRLLERSLSGSVCQRFSHFLNAMRFFRVTINATPLLLASTEVERFRQVQDTEWFGKFHENILIGDRDLATS